MNREDLLAQLEYLLLELEVLGPLLRDLPQEILKAQPLGERSVLEEFARLAHRDRQTIKLLGKVGDERDLPDVEPAVEVASAVEGVRNARQQLVEAVGAVESAGWDELVEIPGREPASLTTVVEAIVLSDLDLLRSLGERLRTVQLGRGPRNSE